MASSITINQGTQTPVAVDSIGGTAYQYIKLDMGTAGVSNPFAGTIPNIGTLGLGTVVGNNAIGAVATGNPVFTGGTDTGGTFHGMFVDTNGHVRTDVITGTINVATATLNGGTLSLGTVKLDSRPVQTSVGYGTQVAGTAAIAATVIGSTSVGVGTSTWVNLLSIDNPYGTVLCVVGFGTAQQGTNVLWRGVLGTQGASGVVIPFPKATSRGMTNQDLVVSLGGAGTVDFSVDYFISA